MPIADAALLQTLQRYDVHEECIYCTGGAERTFSTLLDSSGVPGSDGGAGVTSAKLSTKGLPGCMSSVAKQQQEKRYYSASSAHGVAMLIHGMYASTSTRLMHHAPCDGANMECTVDA